MSTDWSDPTRVYELYTLLDLWNRPTPVLALSLLDRRFLDPEVRAYACHCLEGIDDMELSLYMLQLCQQLKFETYIDSALARFLLRRAIINKPIIGHIFFWFLHSELHNKDVASRFQVLLHVYLLNCGHHRIELGQQMFVMKRLERVAECVQLGQTKEDRLRILHFELNRTVLPEIFQLPLNPSIKVCGINIEKCTVMESKKKPLWLSFRNATRDNNNNDNDEILVMFKVKKIIFQFI